MGAATLAQDGEGWQSRARAAHTPLAETTLGLTYTAAESCSSWLGSTPVCSTQQRITVTTLQQQPRCAAARHAHHEPDPAVRREDGYERVLAVDLLARASQQLFTVNGGCACRIQNHHPCHAQPQPPAPCCATAAQSQHSGRHRAREAAATPAASSTHSINRNLRPLQTPPTDANPHRAERPHQWQCTAL